MKTSNVYILVLIAFLGVSISCEKAMLYGPFHRKNKGKISLPFKAEFFTKRNFNAVIGTCDDADYQGYNYQVGEGTATHLGKFTAELFFCGGSDGYKNGEGVFVAANGDELYYSVPSPGEIGHVLPLPYTDPLYEAYFQDPFTFTGGTGRFEGASGGGYTDSYVDLFVDGDPNQFIDEHQTDHVWTGTLILPKRRR